jgi:predicted O-linked N-acetylglucosamine transferase (SPINDLY family)
MQDALLFETARALQSQGRRDEARKIYRQILKRSPRHFDAQCQLALLAYQEGRIAEALKENERAIRINPTVAGLHNNHGAFLMSLGRHREAAVSFAHAVRLAPRDAQARNNLGGAFYKTGRYQEALTHVDAALAMAPGYAKAYSDRGSILLALGRVEEAVASCDRAIALAPEAWEAHENRGLALLESGRRDDALASFDAAIAANPKLAPLHVNRATVLEQVGRDTDAAESYATALALDPDVRLARGSLLHLRMKDCDWSGFETEAIALLAAIDKGVLASPPFPILAVPATLVQQRKVAALYANFAAGQRPRQPPPRLHNGKIRIAYVSADLFNHAVGNALAPVLEAHDRARFEVWGVSIAQRPVDDVHRRLRAAMDGFVDASSMSDAGVAARINELGVDIAIDLSGYTMKSRPAIFARRAAPVQVSWLGYPGTMALEAMDYLIADAVTVPPEHERHYSEKIIRLPGSLFPATAGREISSRPMSRAEAGLPEGAVVFCSFNNAYKITPDVFDVWMRLLNAEDSSVLWLSARGAKAQVNLAAAAKRRGIDPARLIFAPFAPLPEHLARHRLADIFLDTFYYGAHSTAVDALAAGLPVLTRLGETLPGRVAASLLTSLGLTELIVPDAAAYEKKALDLVRAPGDLVDLKARLSAKVAAAFDPFQFTQALEQAYEQIWNRGRR